MTAPPPSVLVVEHDHAIGWPIVEQLLADGYRARLARTTEHTRVLARQDPPAIVLLGELQTPCAALELLVEIRRHGGTPVIVLSSHAQEVDVVRAFDAGADDFLPRSRGYLELRARLRALLGRTGGRSAGRITVGALVVDLRAHAAHLYERPLLLRRLEYQLLAHLARDPRRVFTRRELLHAVWGHQVPIHTRTLDTHASRLRLELRAHSDEPWVVNVRGVGYRLL